MFNEIVLETDRARAEALSEGLMQAGALSASVEDADAGTDCEEPLFGEPGGEPPTEAWNRSRIVALFDAGADIEVAMRAALGAAGFKEPLPFAARPVADADWVRLTQAQFDPIHVGKDIWIVPSWHQSPADITAASTLLRLDPGLAFGTGSHPTTRLCLCWLEEHLLAAESVIDYGCGSGILAIAARKLGAGRVVGTDIDPQAITASTQNARDNDCVIEFIDSSVFSATSMDADLVVANILSNPLKVLAPTLCRLVRPRGRLVLSGILERQADEVALAYSPWIDLSVWRSEEGWVCMAGTLGSRT